MYVESSSPLKRTRFFLMFKATPDVVNVLVVRLLLDIAPIVAVLLVTVPDAVRFVKPLILLLFIATSAPNAIPVLLKLMIGVFDMFSSFIEVDFNVSDKALHKFPFTVRSFETVRDAAVIVSDVVNELVVSVLVVSVLVDSVLVVRLLLEIVPVAVILTTLIMLLKGSWRSLSILTYCGITCKMLMAFFINKMYCVACNV